MTAKKLTLIQLLNLIDLEDYRGIICKKGFFQFIQKGILPKRINDRRGEVRLTVERDVEDGEKFEVIQYSTPHAREMVGQIH